MLAVMAPGRGATFWLVAVHRRLNSQPSFSPGGSQLRPVSDRDGSCQVWVMASDGGGQHPLTSVGEDGSPTRSPDGTTIVFRSKRDHKGGNRAAINVMGADRSDQHRLIDGEDSYRDWSRVGRRVVLMRRSCGCSEIHAVKPGGSELTRLKCHGSNRSDPAWSPL